MDRENKGKEALDKSSGAVRVLLVLDDKSCHLELARMLRRWGCEVTECNGAKGALARLKKDISGFDTMITERNLPDMDLLQKVALEKDLSVLVMPRDDGVEAMQESIIHVASKPIPKNFFLPLFVLRQYVLLKNIRNLAEVQQPTNDAPKAQKPRFSWTSDLHKIFTDCREELLKKGIKPTPKKIKEPMEAKGVKGLAIKIVKSHKQIPSNSVKDTHNFISMVQKCDEKHKKVVSQMGYNRPSPVHVLESITLATQLQRAPAAVNISSQPQLGAPDCQSFPYPRGYLSNNFMTQVMTQPSSSRQICTSINASTNLLANNPQNQDLDEIVPALSDYLDFDSCDFCDLDEIVPASSDYPDFDSCDFCIEDALPDINFEELDDYFSNNGSSLADKQILRKYSEGKTWSYRVVALLFVDAVTPASNSST